jgi:hypothetical protein
MGDIDEIMALVDELSTIIPKGEFADNITVNSKEDLIETIRYFINKAYLIKTIEYQEYEIEVLRGPIIEHEEKGSQISYQYQIWDCEYDRYVYGHKKFLSEDLAIENAKEVIDDVREELYHG